MKKNLSASLTAQVEGLYMSGLDLLYFMRGALHRADLFDLVPFEREIIAKYINQRLEAEFSKKGANLVY